MKEEKILHALGGIAENFIEEAAPKRKTKTIVKWSTLAASLVQARHMVAHPPRRGGEDRGAQKNR